MGEYNGCMRETSCNCDCNVRSLHNGSTCTTLVSAGGCSRRVLAMSASAQMHGSAGRWRSRRATQACRCHAWGTAQPESGLKAGTLAALQQHRRRTQHPMQAARCGPCFSRSSARLRSCSRRSHSRQRLWQAWRGLWTCVRSGGRQQGPCPAGMPALRSRSSQLSAASRPANRPLPAYWSTACSTGHRWLHTWTPTAGSPSSQPQVGSTPCICTHRKHGVLLGTDP